MNRWKEVAKFAAGAEAFHTFVHVFPDFNLTALGIVKTPTLQVLDIAVNAILALALGVYAWRRPATAPHGVPASVP